MCDEPIVCWFCGHADAMVMENGGFYVQCDSCFARGPLARNVFSETLEETKARAIALWNGHPAQREALEPQTDEELSAFFEKLADDLDAAESAFMDATARWNAFQGE